MAENIIGDKKQAISRAEHKARYHIVNTPTSSLVIPFEPFYMMEGRNVIFYRLVFCRYQYFFSVSIETNQLILF